MLDRNPVNTFGILWKLASSFRDPIIWLLNITTWCKSTRFSVLGLTRVWLRRVDRNAVGLFPMILSFSVKRHFKSFQKLQAVKPEKTNGSSGSESSLIFFCLNLWNNWEKRKPDGCFNVFDLCKRKILRKNLTVQISRQLKMLNGHKYDLQELRRPKLFYQFELRIRQYD